MKPITGPVVTLFAVCTIAWGTLLSGVQTKADNTASPAADSATLVTTGHTLFLTNCAPCHGAQAQGDDGPNLHKLGLPDEAIASTVTTGIKDEMPSFGKKLKPDDLKAVVAYVHSLQ